MIAAVVAVAGTILIGALAGAARADGYYLALDYSRTQPMGVVSIDRGKFTYAAAIGRATDDRIWAKAAAMRVWTWRKVRLKLGASFYAREVEEWRQEQAKAVGARLPPETKTGIRLGADSYVDRGAWASYWMLEFDSTQKASLALASATWKDSGIGVEFSVWKQEDDPVAPTLLARWSPGGGDIALRAGWRFKDDEAFLGISISRFR